MATYHRKAKPGKYHGHQYDSQHEIKWAKALDFHGVKYQSHPYWAKTKIWVPDMVILHRNGRHIIVDIKPRWNFITPELRRKMRHSRVMRKWDVDLAVLIQPYTYDDGPIGMFIEPDAHIYWSDLQ